MSNKIRFAADSDMTGERCMVRFDHSGNITLAPADQSSMRLRGQHKDPTSTDFISPEVQEAALPPACVTFIVGGGSPTLGEATYSNPNEPINMGAGGGGGANNTYSNNRHSNNTVNLNGLQSARSTNSVTPHNADDGIYGLGRGNSNLGTEFNRKSLLTIFFQGTSGLAVPTVPVQPRICFLSQALSFDPPKSVASRPGDVPPAVPSPEVLRLNHGPDQEGCPYELRARNIEPRIHITATANNSICTFSTNLHDTMLFDQNGSAVGPKYGRAFGVLSSMNLKGLTPTAICMSHVCALVTTDGEVMSAPSSPLATNRPNTASSAYSPHGVGGMVGLQQTAAATFASTIVHQHYTTGEEGAMQHRLLEDSLEQMAEDYALAKEKLPSATNPKEKDGGQKAKLSWQATKAKDDALIRASKYTATIAFEPILCIGVNTGSIDVISLPTQKELFRFNTGDIKGSKVIDGYACSQIECVHSMAQSSVTAVIKAAHALEGGGKMWASGGTGSTRNYTPSASGGAAGGNGGTAVYSARGSTGAALKEEASAAPILGSDTPIRSVYAAGFDNGEVLLLSISKSSGELLRKISYGTRPITSIRVGCLPWEAHIPPPYCKQDGRNFHKPSDVNGSGGSASGRDFFQLVWQQRDEFLFEMTHPSDVSRLLCPPFPATGGHKQSNDVSLTPPHSMSETSSILGDDSTPRNHNNNTNTNNSRYPEDRRNEPLHSALGASPSPAAHRNGGGGGNPLNSASLPYGAGAGGKEVYTVPPCHLATPMRIASAAFLRRVATWNNFALVCTAGGTMHLVATTMSSSATGERAEVRTVQEVSIQNFKSFGSIVAAKLLFTVAPGSLAHAECVRRDPAAQRQQLTYLAVSTQANNMLIFRLAFGLTDDVRQGYGTHHTISSVDISLVARREGHSSYINSLTVCPLPNKAFGFAGVNGPLDGSGYFTGIGGADGVAGSTMNGTSRGHHVYPSGGGGGGVHTSASFVSPSRHSHQRGSVFASGNGGGGTFNGTMTSRSGAFGAGMMSNAFGECLGGGGGEGCYFEPMMPFLLVALGIDQKLTFWVCEASLEPPQSLVGGGGGDGSSPDGALGRTRSDRLPTAQRGRTNTMRAGAGGGVGNNSFGVNGTSPNSNLQGTFSSAGGFPPSSRLPVAFSISHEVAFSFPNNNPKEEFEPWTSITSCALDGHQSFMCLGLRGRAKFFDCEVEENSGRIVATSSSAAAAAAANQQHAHQREARESSRRKESFRARQNSF